MGSQLVRFALVGVVNTVLYYGIYILLLMWLPYLAAHLSAFVLATVASFFLNARFTYRTRPTWAKFLRFPLSTLVNLAVTTVGLRLLVETAHVHSRLAPLLAAAAAVPLTFVTARAIMLAGTTEHGEDGGGCVLKAVERLGR
jgi:putative flippase GtrA